MNDRRQDMPWYRYSYSVTVEGVSPGGVALGSSTCPCRRARGRRYPSEIMITYDNGIPMMRAIRTTIADARWDHTRGARGSIVMEHPLTWMEPLF